MPLFSEQLEGGNLFELFPWVGISRHKKTKFYFLRECTEANCLGSCWSVWKMDYDHLDPEGSLMDVRSIL